jgi:hypothetical protein
MRRKAYPDARAGEIAAGSIAGTGPGLVLCMVSLLFSTGVHADEPGYRFVSVKTILGPCCTDSGSDLVVDVDGAVFVAGLRGGLDLDRDGTIDVPTFGSPDPLIFKAYEGTNEHGWVQGPGGPKRDAAHGIDLDRDGGAFVVGIFQESMRIGGGTLVSAGKQDGFLARYGRHGEPLWAMAIGGEDNDDLFGVASDAAGNVFVIGTIHGPVDVDRDGTIDVVPTGASAALLASFDPDGNMRWAHASAGPGTARGQAIAAGPRGDIYIGGHYRNGTIDLDGDGKPDGPLAAPSETVTPESDLNGYFARFDASGSMIWARSVSGPAVQVVGSLVIAGNGDLLVLGGYTDSADFDADGVPDLEFLSMADRKWEHHADANTFLLRVTPEGERRWARRYTAAATHAAADATRIVLSGSYNGPLDLEGDGMLERDADPDPQREGFAAILDGEGRVRHVFTIVGEDSDVANAAGFSPDGKRLYVTGYTKLGADYDGDGVIENASACHQLGDLFLAVYDVEDR